MPTYIRVKDLANAATTPATDDFILLSGAANGARKISRADFLTAVAGFYTADPSTYKLATLDAGNKVLVSQLPSSAFSYQGTWAASTNTPTLANGTGTAGDTYYASDSGSVNFGAGSISFLAGDAVVYDGSVWQKVPDVVNLLDGKGTLDEAKTTLEIPDVGTAPGETPLNQHLGSLAYQSADSVAVAELQVESTTGTATTQALTVTDGSTTGLVVQEDGKVSVRGKVSLNVDGSASWGSAEDYGKLTWDTGKAIVRGESGKSLSLGSNGTQDHLIVDTSGNVGIGGSPSYDLHVTNASTAASIGITGTGGSKDTWTVTSSDGGGKALLNFKDEDTANTVMSLHQDSLVGIGTDSPDFTLDVAGDIGVDYKIYHNGDHDTFLAFTGDTFTVRTGGADRLTINNSAIQMGTGMGIDFGAVATSAGDGTGTTGTVSNQVFSDYEFGSWVPTFATTGVDFTTMTVEVVAAQYVKVGRVVHCQAYLRTDNVDATGASGTVVVDGLPFVSDTTADNFSTLNVGYSASWVNAPAAGYLQPNAAYVRLTRYSTTGASTITPSDLTAGASADKNTLIFSLSYIAST